MADETRLSLAMPFEPRDSTLNKDSLLTNCFMEQSKMGTVYVTKRPGFEIGFGGSTTTNLGIFYNNGQVYYIDGTDPSILYGFTPSGGGGFGFYNVLNDEDFV